MPIRKGKRQETCRVRQQTEGMRGVCKRVLKPLDQGKAAWGKAMTANRILGEPTVRDEREACGNVDILSGEG